ncbi:MAG TPA: AsmA family protein [Modicisalibacter sp.]|nr:AsmA family protein [Modicisalibacter sp.]
MAKTLRLVLISLGAVVLLLVAIAMLLESAWAKNLLESQVSQRLGGRAVEIGDLEIDWRWPLVVRLEEVSVANADWARHEQMLQLAMLELTIKPGALLQGNIALGRLYLERPVVHLARNESGTANWSGLMKKGEGGGGVAVSLDRVRVDQAVVTYWEPTLEESRLTGSLSAVLGETPRIEARIDVDRVDLDRLGIINLDRAEEREEVEQEVEQVVEEIAWDRRWAEQLAPLRHYEAQLDLSVGRLSYGDVVLRDVELVGQLENDRLDVQRLHVAQGEGELTLKGWLEVQPNTLRGDVDAQLAQVDLGEALAPLGYGELGTLGGRLHVRFVEGTLALDDTQLDYRAPAQEVTLSVSAETADIAGASVPGVHLQGNGTYSDRPFAFDLVVGPLLDLNNPNTPYPVQGKIVAEDTTLTVDGTIRQPLEIAAVDGHFQLSGPNPARLNRLTGLNLPALPPYRIEGELHVEDDLVRLLDLRGRFGDSDVNGDVQIKLGERPMLWATLGSERLDLDDFLPLVGAAPDTQSGDVASPAQQQRARQQENQPGIFPDREWNLQGLRAMDAIVRYRADSVSAQHLPLNDVRLELEMEDGILTLEPLHVGIGGGEARSQITLDASGSTLRGHIDISLEQVNLKPLLRRAELSDVAADSAGVIDGHAEVRFHGDSMDEAMANLYGELELAMSGGKLGVVAVELLGLDVGEALVAALVDPSDSVPIDCAYSHFKAKDGLALLEQFFMNTEDSNVTGGGVINLDEERMTLAFEAHPKDFSLLASDSPVSLTGPLDDLGVDVTSRELVIRGVLSAIGALLAPPLAILPWIEMGTGEDVGPSCQQVLEKFHSPVEQG